MAQVFSSVKPKISQPTFGSGFNTTTPSMSSALQGKINPSPLSPIKPKITLPGNYLSPQVKAKSPTAPVTPPATGYSNPFLGGGGSNTGGQTIQSPAPPAPTSNLSPRPVDYSSQEDPYQKSVRALANTSQGNPTSNAAATGLLGIAQNGSNDVRQMTQNIKGLQQTQAEIANNPNVASEVASGRGQALTGQIQAAQTGLSNALQGQGQQITAGTNAGSIGNTQQSNQIGALSSAGGLAAPQAGASFFGSPTSGGLVGGNTGAGGATGNPLVDSSVQAAIAKYKAGGNINDARASISSLGQPALNAFDQAINGGSYNPTGLGAAANQNAAQGSTYQGKAADLNTNLTQMKTVTAPVLSLLQKADLNQQDVPSFNGSINEYQSQFLNPANQASLKAGIAELKTYVSNILGTGGDLTPTDVTKMVNSFDPGNFTRQQLSDFLDNLNNYGQARLQGFQQSSQGSYGGNMGFTGASANPSTEAKVSPNTYSDSGLQNSPIGQGLVGGAMNALGGIENAIKGIAGSILK